MVEVMAGLLVLYSLTYSLSYLPLEPKAEGREEPAEAWTVIVSIAVTGERQVKPRPGWSEDAASATLGQALERRGGPLRHPRGTAVTVSPLPSSVLRPK
jgi:hypothetical protein